MPKNIRDYGLPDCEVIGAPRVLHAVDQRCPYCDCDGIYQIEVDVRQSLLKGGRGVVTYLGCAACCWASPMLTKALGETSA